MKQPLAFQLWHVFIGQWRVLLGVLPGLALTMLGSTMLDVPRGDFIAALDSDRYRIQWIVGSAMVGSAAGMALTRFFGSRLGLRRTYLFALACFIAASGGCAAVSDVLWMAPLRVVQGFGTGLLISSGMVLIWRSFPTGQRELAMALYGMAVYGGAIAGAPLGGLLVTWGSWRWIFLINVPLGLTAFLLAWLALPTEPAGQHKVGLDLIGFALLIALMVTLNVVLDWGQYWGWLASPYLVPWLAALLVSLAGFIAWGVWAPAPLVGLRPLGRAHFALGLGIKVLFSANLFVLVGILGGYMVGLRGYQWWQASLVLLPGLIVMPLAVLAGAFFGNDDNRRARLLIGLAVMMLATLSLAAVDVYTAKGWQAVHVAIWAAGAGLILGPALITAFEGMSLDETLRTAGVFNILRSAPAFFVGGVLATLLTQRSDAHFDTLRQNIQFNRPVVERMLRDTERHLVARGSSRLEAARQSHGTLGKWVHVNARAFAIQEIFLFLAVVPAAGMVLALFVKPPGRLDADGS